jgi:threonine dehydrogenase-like Zn-dependent dehydrogenase
MYPPSELHVYRGHQPSGTEFIMGHEFTGHVHEVGSSIKNFKKGDHVVAPFVVSCGECFYCTHGYSSRCEKVLLFGSVPLDGAQAEYVRVPLADSTAVMAPSGIKDEVLVLMADIFPTGTYGTSVSNDLQTRSEYLKRSLFAVLYVHFRYYHPPRLHPD